jgi:hypothetical protein
MWKLVSHIKGRHTLWVFKNRMLKRIFGPKRSNKSLEKNCIMKELHKFCSSNIIRVITSRNKSCGGKVAHMEKMRNTYKILVRKLAGNIPYERPKHRWENNIKIVLKEIGYEGVDWIHVAQNRDQWWDLVNTVMNLWFP